MDESWIEDCREKLEQTGNFKILDFIRGNANQYFIAPEGAELFQVCILDTETTSLDTSSCEIIELGYKIIEFDKNGFFFNVLKSKNFFNEPKMEISEAITRVTGITIDTVKGHSIPWEEVAFDMKEASLIIAHNSKFDRPVVERYLDAFKDKDWACSLEQVDWEYFSGVRQKTLDYLCFKYGNFVFEPHRAINDVEALSRLLTSPNPIGITPFFKLLGNVNETSYRVMALNAPFEAKDALKENGFNWNINKRIWEIVVGISSLDETLELCRGLGSKNPTSCIILNKDRFSVRDV